MRILGLAILLTASTAHAGDRFASVGVGGAITTQAGEDPPDVPALLRDAPELQLAWGLRLGDAVILTRLDLLGAIVPIGPAGVGLELGGGWEPRRDGWAPVARGFVGGVAFASGGEMMGPDHTSHGFRLAAEVGAVHRRRVPAGSAAWGVILGAQAIGLTTVDPCSSSGDCDTALLGVTARLEAQLEF